MTVSKSGGSRAQWMTLTAALLGWLFDGFEMGMFPVIGQPALKELLAGSTEEAISRWFGVIMAMFLIGAATGGVVFGWLGDRIGRVRAMSLSIFTYAIFTGLCGLAAEAWHIAALRFIASMGMGGEWALGVALVTEIWPNKSRAFIAGLIGAAANVGYVLVALMSLYVLQSLSQAQGFFISMGFPESLAARLLNNQAWRLLMIAGALPALLIFFIRIMVPESEKWRQQKTQGTTSHWATRDLLGVLIGALGASLVAVVWSPASTGWPAKPALQLLGTALGVFVALRGYMYPVRSYLRRAKLAGAIQGDAFESIHRRLLLGASLAGVALLGTWGAIQWAPRWAMQLEPDPMKHAKEWTQVASSGGAILFTILAALLGEMVGRRISFSIICAASLASALLLYQTNSAFGGQFLLCTFLAGGITAAFYGWFPLYMPELFPTAVRATSQGFAFNFGRILAAIGTLQTATLIGLFDGSFPMAGSVLSAIYLVGLVLIWFCPETKGKPLPD